MTVKQLEEFLKLWREDMPVCVAEGDEWRSAKIELAETEVGDVLLISVASHVEADAN